MLPDAQRLQTVLDARLAGNIEVLRQMVAIPSVNPAFGGVGEREVQNYVAGRLQDMGADIQVWEVGPGRPDVLATFFGQGAPTILLNSHVDTAPVDRKRWRTDPFEALLQDGMLHGLGVIDAKGELAVFIAAVDLLLAADVPVARPIAIASVADEEAGGAGTLSSIDRCGGAGMAIVGEATGMEVCPATRGAFQVRVMIEGRTAHLGRAYEGVSALEKGARYLERFRRLEGELDAWHMHPLWEGLPVAHVTTATRMEVPNPTGGVPDRCRITWSVGYIAGEAFDEVKEKVESAIADVGEADPWLRAHPPSVEIAPPHIEPAATDADHVLVAAFREAFRELGIGGPVVRALSAGTDGRHLVNRGGIPTVNFGPGELALAHSEHEALSVADFRKSVLIVASVLARLCT